MFRFVTSLTSFKVVLSLTFIALSVCAVALLAVPALS